MNTVTSHLLKKILVPALLAVAAVGSAAAATFTVDATGNSANGGTPVSTGLVYTAGQSLLIDVDPSDLWGAQVVGTTTWSNADGLNKNLYATGSDESGAAAGTLIGVDYGLYTQYGLSAPYGALVGEIGGSYFLVGTHYAGPAVASGELHLMYWDSNSFDNHGSIVANVSAVPEPSGTAMAGLGLVALALASRRKLKQQAERS